MTHFKTTACFSWNNWSIDRSFLVLRDALFGIFQRCLAFYFVEGTDDHTMTRKNLNEEKKSFGVTFKEHISRRNDRLRVRYTSSVICTTCMISCDDAMVKIYERRIVCDAFWTVAADRFNRFDKTIIRCTLRRFRLRLTAKFRSDSLSLFHLRVIIYR